MLEKQTKMRHTGKNITSNNSNDISSIRSNNYHQTEYPPHRSDREPCTARSGSLGGAVRQAMHSTLRQARP